MRPAPRTLVPAVLTMLFAFSMVPTAQADDAPIADPCTDDPEAWVNYCPTNLYTNVTAYQVTLDPAYQRICPLSGTCVDLLKPSSIVVQPTVVTVVTPWVDVDVNTERIVNDVCSYLDLQCCLSCCCCCCWCPDTAAAAATVVEAVCEGFADCTGTAGFVQAEDGKVQPGVVVTLDDVPYFLPYHAEA